MQESMIQEVENPVKVYSGLKMQEQSFVHTQFGSNSFNYFDFYLSSPDWIQNRI